MVTFTSNKGRTWAWSFLCKLLFSNDKLYEGTITMDVTRGGAGDEGAPPPSLFEEFKN